MNRELADYVERLRRRLAEGKSEIDRQRNEAGATRRHIDEMSRWLGRSEELRGN